MKKYITLPEVPIRTITIDSRIQPITNGNVEIPSGGGGGSSPVQGVKVNGTKLTPDSSKDVNIGIKVNGEAVTPAADGSVDITVPPQVEVPIQSITFDDIVCPIENKVAKITSNAVKTISVNGGEKTEPDNGNINLTIPDESKLDQIQVNGTNISISSKVSNIKFTVNDDQQKVSVENNTVNLTVTEPNIQSIYLDGVEQSPESGVVSLSSKVKQVKIATVDSSGSRLIEPQDGIIDLTGLVTKAELEEGVKFNTIEATDLLINGKRPAVVGHTHTKNDLELSIPSNLEQTATLANVITCINDLLQSLRVQTA